MLKTQEDFEETASRSNPAETVVLVSPEKSESYWRREFLLDVLIGLPILLAFDQSLRYGLLHGWVKPDVFTAFCLRPALVFLARRSLSRWLKTNLRGMGLFFATMAGLDWATYKTDPFLTACAVTGTGLLMAVAEIVFHRDRK